VALGQQHGAVSCVKECALSALRVLVLGLRAGKVCAISALCAISRRIELEGDGTTSFLQPFDDGLPPRRAGVRSCCGAKLSKTCQSQEDTHWAHPCSLRNHLLTLRAPRWAKEYRVERVESQFCLTMNSLRGPRKDAAVSAESALSTHAFCKLIAAHGNSGSVRSRAGPSR
jgi:hypothetical protein